MAYERGLWRNAESGKFDGICCARRSHREFIGYFHGFRNRFFFYDASDFFGFGIGSEVYGLGCDYRRWRGESDKQAGRDRLRFLL